MDVSYQLRRTAQRLECELRKREKGKETCEELRSVIANLMHTADEAFLRAYKHREPDPVPQNTQPGISEWVAEMQGTIQSRLKALEELGVPINWS